MLGNPCSFGWIQKHSFSEYLPVHAFNLIVQTVLKGTVKWCFVLNTLQLIFTLSGKIVIYFRY